MWNAKKQDKGRKIMSLFSRKIQVVDSYYVISIEPFSEMFILRNDIQGLNTQVKCSTLKNTYK